mgnify:FL=1
MKKILYLLITFLMLTNAFAQIIQPVKWKSKVEKISETEFNLILNGTIDKDWHVYSQFTPEDGPLPMVLNFKDQNRNFELLGKAQESPYKKLFNDIFGVDEYYFEHNVTIKQKVKILNPKYSKIKLNLEYQVCKTSCINENKDLVFDIPAVSNIVVATADTVKIKEEQVFSTSVDTSKVAATIQQAAPKVLKSVKVPTVVKLEVKTVDLIFVPVS